MRTYSTIIIGAGLAGLGTAIRLLDEGIEDFVILERGSDIGGTWCDKTYPGAACDIPSLLDSYSFSQNPESRGYAKGSEILSSVHDMAQHHDLRRFIRTGVDVQRLTFDEAEGLWSASTSSAGEGERRYLGRAVVMATGPLSNASLPDMEGIESYEGHKMHSARWDHDYDFAGKRVAVIGTGASAVQIIPKLVDQVESLSVFQRTAGWVLPRFDHNNPGRAKSLFRRSPRVQRAARDTQFRIHEALALGRAWNTTVTRCIEAVAKAHLRSQVRDKWLRRQLTPEFHAGCKRMLMSNDYYPALQRENCRLVTWPIVKMCPEGIRTADGLERHFDCVVFATGYDVVMTTGTPFPVEGKQGRLLAEQCP